MSSQVFVAPIENGICVQIVGKGSMHESAFIRDAIVKVLKNDPSAQAVIDLSRCDYLDSTLLGCLITIHKVAAGRWRIVAPQKVVDAVLKPTRLDSMLPITPDAPVLLADPVRLDIPPTRMTDLTTHLYECHAQLAQVPGPLQSVFSKIAEQMKRDLDKVG